MRWSGPVWWAREELNLRPLPCQQNTGNRCAKRRSRTHGVGPCQGRERVGPPAGPAGWLACGVGGGGGTGGAQGPDDIAELAPCTHSGPNAGVRMTVSPDPGCSVRSTAVVQAHAKTRARPVGAFSDADVASSWDRICKARASSRRAIATVAMFVPRRRAS
jgi:hypothetical protein